MASRRMFLRGLGGVTLGLPFLESLVPREARAVAAEVPHYSVFVRQANGVAQADNGEPEQYWPRTPGAISQASLSGTDADRALSELADYADRMLIVKGANFAFPGNGCGHSGGGNQCLTAAQVSADPSGNLSLAMGESIDNYIARQHAHNGGEPLTLYTGPRNGYIEEVLSYRGAKDLRSAEDDPWNAYQRMIGGDAALDLLLSNRRKSVNDLVRGQMQALMGRPELSASDKQRLELHFDSIRDFEVLSCFLTQEQEDEMLSLAGQGTSNDLRVRMAELHSDLIAIAFACDHVRSATLQVGDGNDSTQYTVDGERFPSFHQVSHRIYSDGSEGDPIAGAVDMHHKIDRLHLQIFRYLLDKIDAYGLLDQSVCVHTNDLGTPTHRYVNVPFIVVGGGDGTLAQGQFVDLGGVSHNKVLNTLITATGIRTAGGDPIEDFGDPSLDPGLASEMLA
jgi:hypothetical protein